MPPPVNPRDPWRSAPVGELQDQLLPRWFVILILVLIPVAIAAVVAAFVVFRPAEVPVAERRPPPAGDLTSDVGQFVVGEATPEPYADVCPTLRGVQIAGTEDDRQALRLGLAGLCNVSLPGDVSDRLARFAQAGGVVRFSAFEQTGVDSTAQVDPPRILINARLQLTDPLWIAPLVAHDATLLGADAEPGTVAAALEARQAEVLVCERLLSGRRSSRGCADARELLDLPDPAAALRAAGFR